MKGRCLGCGEEVHIHEEDVVIGFVKEEGTLEPFVIHKPCIEEAEISFDKVLEANKKESEDSKQKGDES